VAVGDDEVETGSGFALALYLAIKAKETAFRPLTPIQRPPTFNGTQASWEKEARKIRLRTLRAWARQADAMAEVVDYLLTNAQIQVGVADSGLQNLPAVLASGNPTAAPGAPVTFGNLL